MGVGGGEASTKGAGLLFAPGPGAEARVQLVLQVDEPHGLAEGHEHREEEQEGDQKNFQREIPGFEPGMVVKGMSAVIVKRSHTLIYSRLGRLLAFLWPKVG